VDTSDFGGSVQSIVMAVGGVAVGAVILSYGSSIGSYLTARIDQLTGADASGQGLTMEFGG
jgi:hypothetical protein